MERLGQKCQTIDVAANRITWKRLKIDGRYVCPLEVRIQKPLVIQLGPVF